MFKFEIGQAVRTKNGKRVGKVFARSNDDRGAWYEVAFDDEAYSFLEESLKPAADPSAPDARHSQPAAAPSSLGLSQGSADETPALMKVFKTGQRVRSIADNARIGTVFKMPDGNPCKPYVVAWDGEPVSYIGPYADDELELVSELEAATRPDDNPPVHFKFRFGDRVLATAPMTDFYEGKTIDPDDTVRIVRVRAQASDGTLMYGLSSEGHRIGMLLYAAEPDLIPAPEQTPEPVPSPATITATEHATGKQVELLSSVPVHYGRHVDAKGQPLVVIDGIMIGPCEEVASRARAAFHAYHSTA